MRTGPFKAGASAQRHVARLKPLVVVAFALLVTGCTWQVRMMPRNSGLVYAGTGKGDGMGGGTITIAIDGRTYSGPVMRVAADQTFGLFQAFGSDGTSTFGTSMGIGGTIKVKALLSSPDGHGLRCDLSGDGMGHLGGICLDDKQTVYDVLANR